MRTDRRRREGRGARWSRLLPPLCFPIPSASRSRLRRRHYSRPSIRVAAAISRRVPLTTALGRGVSNSDRRQRRKKNNIISAIRRHNIIIIIYCRLGRRFSYRKTTPEERVIFTGGTLCPLPRSLPRSFPRRPHTHTPARGRAHTFVIISRYHCCYTARAYINSSLPVGGAEVDELLCAAQQNAITGRAAAAEQ